MNVPIANTLTVEVNVALKIADVTIPPRFFGFLSLNLNNQTSDDSNVTFASVGITQVDLFHFPKYHSTSMFLPVINGNYTETTWQIVIKSSTAGSYQYCSSSLMGIKV